MANPYASITRTSPNILSARTTEWSAEQRLGAGLLAFVPVALLGAALTAFALSAIIPVSIGVALAYVHVAVQLLVIMMFTNLVVESTTIANGTKIFWVVFFLALAPVATVAFWWVHILSRVGDKEPSIRVHRV